MKKLHKILIGAMLLIVAASIAVPVMAWCPAGWVAGLLGTASGTILICAINMHEWLEHAYAMVQIYGPVAEICPNQN